MRLIEGWTEQVVHCAIYHYERLSPILFYKQHSGEQNACFRDNRSARFEHHDQVQFFKLRQQPRCEFSNTGAAFLLPVLHAKAAAQIEKADGQTCRAQPCHKRQRFVRRFE